MHESDVLTPERLRAICGVAATGSFTATAVELGTSQSNVSRAVATVEAALGVALFDRSTRSVRLTEAGSEFVERATSVRAELDAAVRAVKPNQAPPPRLVLASLSSVSELYLPRVLAKASTGHVRLRCIEGLQAAVEHAVMSGAAVAAFGDLATLGVGLTGHSLWSENFRVAIPRGHQLASRRSLRFQDLAQESLVGFSRDAELRTTLDRELASARQLRSPDVVVDRYRTALSFVAEGAGVMVVPAIVAAARPEGISLVPLDEPEMERTMGLIYRYETPPSPDVQELASRLQALVTPLPGVTT